jgi:hypothetical protein
MSDKKSVARRSEKKSAPSTGGAAAASALPALAPSTPIVPAVNVEDEIAKRVTAIGAASGAAKAKLQVELLGFLEEHVRFACFAQRRRGFVVHLSPPVCGVLARACVCAGGGARLSSAAAQLGSFFIPGR